MNTRDAAAAVRSDAHAANPLFDYARPGENATEPPFGLPPFGAIAPEYFAPAFAQAMAEHRAELDAIAAQAAAPSFDNTVAAYDRAGQRFRRLQMLFANLGASHTSPALQAAERELAPQLAAHANAVFLNAALFARIDAVHGARDGAALAPEQRRLVERVHTDFVRAGARLAPAARQRYAAITERLAALYTQFGQAVLADESATVLWIDSEPQLSGLPAALRDSARAAAAERGELGRYAVPLSRSTVEPFLTFSARRELREQLWRAWAQRGELNPERNNTAVVREIMALRQEQAALHGCANYAQFRLADTMAGTPAAVHALLDRVWAPALRKADEERALLLDAARADGITQLQPWDWRYYAERVRAAHYALDGAALKEYFALDNMVAAMFDCAGRLFGLRFEPLHGLPLYHPDVRAYAVRRAAPDAAGDALVGVFLLDPFARASKRSGAWMSSYRLQRRDSSGARVPPIIVNNCNFAKAPPGEPTLLSLADVTTLFHEFGHGLHGLLSNVQHERLAGTQVLRDFVELPSQLFEHWGFEPRVLRRFARHVRSGEPLPDAQIERIQRAMTFNQGCDTLEYTASAMVDLALHERADAGTLDIAAFERDTLQRIGLPHDIAMRHRLPHFQHLFSSDAYAAAYYVYLWAEVLEADAYDAFTEAGDPFDPATAQRLHDHIYSAGNSAPPQDAYRAFRGRDAGPQAMLRQRGLV